MGYYITKIAVTTILIVLISEIAKRSSFAGAILASIPLISVLAMIWLYIDTKDVFKVIVLSSSIFWLVLPSLMLFIALPFLLKNGVGFYAGMIASLGLTVFSYWFMILVLDYFGVKL